MLSSNILDAVKFSFNVLDKDKEDVNKGAFDGVYVYSLEKA